MPGPTEALAAAVGKMQKHAHLGGFPHLSDGSRWIISRDGDWTGGFWVGLLWAAFVETARPDLRQAAEMRLGDLLPRAREQHNHDLGMMFLPSAVWGYEITGRPDYREAALAAATTLAAQFNPAGAFIPGWGYFGVEGWEGAVLVDSLMNLPLLVWATNHGGPEHLREVALAHAATSVRHHIRPDGSTFHVFRFDPTDGSPIGGDTYQGLNSQSCWSRGQAWAIAGLAQLARLTGDPTLARAARAAADFFCSHLPPDDVPFWDFAVTSGPRDSSAAAIGAWGLIQLAAVEDVPAYLKAADQILDRLVAEYMAPLDAQPILLHATADLPHNRGVDGATVYGDYFFVRALQERAHARR